MYVNKKVKASRLSLTLIGGAFIFFAGMPLAKSDANVNFSGKLINVPCKLDNDNDINVNFGDNVLVSNLDGKNYIESLSLVVTCEENYAGDLDFRVSGTVSTFDKSAIKTDINNVGIKFINGMDDSPFEINKRYKYTQNGRFILKVVPVKASGSTPDVGKLKASAQLLIEVQ